MEGSALVIEHDVVGAGDPMMKLTPAPQEDQEVIDVILIRFGVIGVADVAAQRAGPAASRKMIFQAGADDLLAVEKAPVR